MPDPMVQDRDGAVLTCTVTDCSYNRQLECFAPKIQVGEEHPYCDTYTSGRVEPAPMESFVGSCLTWMCEFNDDRQCTARGVTVDCHGGHADCATFRA